MGLFWKIFVSFTLAMAATIVATVYVSFEIAEQAFNQNIEGRDKIIQEVADSLVDRGERGLRKWLAEHQRPMPGTLLYVTDEHGRELLGRALPPHARRLLAQTPRRSGLPWNLRPVQLAPHIVDPATGEEYQLIFARAPIVIGSILMWPGTQFAVLSIALIAATGMSLLLARYLSSPIVRLQRVSRALAAGTLEARVGAPFNRRKDEVGRLARDFDTMAERVQALVMGKEALLRDVSHELRSPLARMRVALALAQRRANAETQPDLERIEREAERLDQLVGQVMTLTRLRTADAPQRVPVDFNALVSEVVEDARYEHRDARLEFHAAEVPKLLGNPSDLKSAVENVVRNALIHGDPTQPIEVRLEPGRGEIVLTVLDRGPGVPEPDLERIFEPFYRIDKSRDHRSDNGQGIGLAITTRVVELHGGTITATNREGGGLAITIRLPAGATA